MKIKTAPVRVKAAGEDNGLEPGQFEAIVSVFGNKDAYGDIMMPTAFDDTLKEWAESGDPIPVIFSHDWGDPESHIGVLLDARTVAADEEKKTPAGLWVKGALDIEDNKRAERVAKLLKGRRIRSFSFGYEERTAGFGKHNGEEGWLVHSVGLYEVGPTLVGANADTTLLGAKRAIIDLAAAVKAGSRHSAGDMETLRSIHDALGALGVACDPDSDGKSHQGGTGKSTQTDPEREGLGTTPTPTPVKTPPLVSLVDLDMVLMEIDLEE